VDCISWIRDNMPLRPHRPKYRSDPKTSVRMQRVKRVNTGPETVVQGFLSGRGLTFRLHGTELAGCPDIVFPELRKVIFVHGCYWHRHSGCSRATLPARNTQLWSEKFERNVKRDRRNYRLLRVDGWRILTVWECQIRRSLRWQGRILRFLGMTGLK
jgi:DNA mismatch endonuclease, patch repair protein